MQPPRKCAKKAARVLARRGLGLCALGVYGGALKKKIRFRFSRRLTTGVILNVNFYYRIYVCIYLKKKSNTMYLWFLLHIEYAQTLKIIMSMPPRTIFIYLIIIAGNFAVLHCYLLFIYGKLRIILIIIY